MTPEQALIILDKAVSGLSLTRAGHRHLGLAVETLRQVLLHVQAQSQAEKPAPKD